MSIFDFAAQKPLGTVQSVDTASVIIHVDDSDQLSKLQVNNLLVIRSSKPMQNLIGLVSKIMRKYGDVEDIANGEEIAVCDIVKASLIGTFLDKDGTTPNVFKRTLESVPEINSKCFIMTGSVLTAFMGAIAKGSASLDNPLCIGNYILNDDSDALIDGNKFFQRHAVITGSTGSGKSYTVATIIEQIAKLDSADAIVFDIHGEYGPLTNNNIKHYKIAGPSDKQQKGIMFLPYWLLTYEEMVSMMLDRSDNNAPNQAMAFSNAVLSEKEAYLKSKNKMDVLANFTLDSPIPYNIDLVIKKLDGLDKDMIPGSGKKDKQGPLFGRLTRFIQRLTSKISDKRLNFMFCNENFLQDYNYMNELCKALMEPKSNGGGVKIIDFSEVPSDMLPLVVSLLARVVFTVQQWMDENKRHPIALFCDEAHLYIPAEAQEGVEASSLHSFARIAKEGRKYGIGLVVITQRPSEVNRTVLSQSNNFIAMRLTNADDQNVVKRLLPDSLGNFSEMLPILGIGEALVVGDASLLPSRIKINEPDQKPNSATIKFWDKWSENDISDGISDAVEALRKQSKGSK